MINYLPVVQLNRFEFVFCGSAFPAMLRSSACLRFDHRSADSKLSVEWETVLRIGVLCWGERVPLPSYHHHLPGSSSRLPDQDRDHCTFAKKTGMSTEILWDSTYLVPPIVYILDQIVKMLLVSQLLWLLLSLLVLYSVMLFALLSSPLTWSLLRHLCLNQS